jgi:hypothetical protein
MLERKYRLHQKRVVFAGVCVTLGHFSVFTQLWSWSMCAAVRDCFFVTVDLGPVHRDLGLVLEQMRLDALQDGERAHVFSGPLQVLLFVTQMIPVLFCSFVSHGLVPLLGTVGAITDPATGIIDYRESAA